MSKEIRQYIEACGTCATYADRQPAQIIAPVPERPWQQVAADLLSWGGNNYLITVDRHSNFFEIDKLDTLTSEAMIECMKAHFACHGIPEVLTSDNGPAFRRFASKWLFIHETISPGNSQANGAAEAAVKITKRLFRKSKASGEDPFLGLLNICNAPTEGLITSPAQRLFGRRTRSTVPAVELKLKPLYPHSTDEAWRKQERRIRHHKTGKELKGLNVGDNV